MPKTPTSHPIGPFPSLRWPLVVLGCFLLFLPLGRYLTLNSAVADLGFFTNHLFNVGRDPSQWHLVAYGHLHPLMALYAFFYRVFPYPAMLVASQSFLILLTPFLLPISYSRERPFYYSFFLLCYAVWYTALFDFHFDHLLMPLTALFYLLLQRRNFRGSAAAAVAVALIKEPFALVTSMMGLYLILKHRRFRLGSFLFIFGIVYFYLAVYRIIPFFSPAYQLPGENAAFGHLGDSPGRMVLYPFLHPGEFLRLLSVPGKAVYLLSILGAFGFAVVLFSPLELLPALPLMAIALLSKHYAFYNIHFHYGAGLVVPFLMAFIGGWPRFARWCAHITRGRWTWLKDARKLAVLVLGTAVISHIALAPSPFSFFFYKKHLYRNFLMVGPETTRNRMIRDASKQFIPADPTVSVSVQGVLNFAHLAHRRYFMIFPQGVFEPIRRPHLEAKGMTDLITRCLRGDRSIIREDSILADCVVLDRKRIPWVMKMQGGDVTRANEDEWEGLIDRTQDLFDVAYEKDGFIILKRKAPFSARKVP